ncbi:helix-turn-helix domain-containing protein [Prescottella equi]|uniref:helix-turn-helix domain-containing protein n=1 Tax=Rhodococcus hoagii TaxID=43767 RepID=UPI0021BBEA84|nr:helix-turn-helix domain-containing protein [Prescottella equi]
MAEAADRLGVSRKTVGRMYRSGELPHVRLGRTGRWIRIVSADLEQYIQNRRVTEAA